MNRSGSPFHGRAGHRALGRNGDSHRLTIQAPRPRSRDRQTTVTSVVIDRRWLQYPASVNRAPGARGSLCYDTADAVSRTQFLWFASESFCSGVFPMLCIGKLERFQPHGDTWSLPARRPRRRSRSDSLPVNNGRAGGDGQVPSVQAGSPNSRRASATLRSQRTTGSTTHHSTATPARSPADRST